MTRTVFCSSEPPAGNGELPLTKQGPIMTVDEAILRAFEGGPVTVSDVTKRFLSPVRIRLEKLRVRGVVVREGKGACGGLS